MHRAGGIVLMILAGLGVLGVMYLLFGEALLPGVGTGSGRSSSAQESADLLGATDGAGLEAHGVRRPSPEEVAAKQAEVAAAARQALKSEGVFGRVTNARGHAIHGALVKLLPDPPALRRRQGAPDLEPIHTTVTDEQGMYVVGPSPADGYAKLRAEAAGFGPTLQPVRQRGVRVDLILDRGGALRVRLMDEQGVAVADATVLHQAGPVVTMASSDASGMASFAALPTGTGSLVVTKVGYGAVRDTDVAVAPGATETRTLVLPKALEIAGTVSDLDTQRPIAGARVAARYPNLPGLDLGLEETPVSTDEDGRFRIPAYVSGQEQVMLRVTHPDYGEGRAARNASAQGEVTIKLHRLGEAIRGRVVDPQRQPVAGVTVTYAWQQQEDPETIPTTSSDADGAFSLPLPPWATPGSAWALIAIGPEAGVGTARASVPKKDQPPAGEIEIQIGGAGTVAGVVSDRGGAPVAGALVTLVPDWNAGRNRPGRKRVPWQLLRVLYDGQHHNLTAVTGSDGTYTLTGVPAVDFRASASHGLDQVTVPDAVRVAAGETRRLDIALGEGGVIEGWILDSEEKPIAGAYVSAKLADNGGESYSAELSARSQSDGHFVLRGIGDADYTVSARASGYGSAREKNVGRNVEDLVLRLKARGWIEGVVRIEGRPYRGLFTVQVSRVNAGSNMMNNFRSGWNGGQQARTFSTDDGTFQIRGMNAGDYTVRAVTNDGQISIEGRQVTVVDGRGTRPVELELVRGAVLSGTLRDGETGRGIPNGWVYATLKQIQGGAPPPNTYAMTDVNGTYELQGLGTGSYTLTAYAADGTNITRSIELTAGEQRTLDIVRERPGTVTFLVTDEQGQPVRGARPNIRTDAGGWVNVNANQMRKEGLLDGRYDWRTLYETNADGLLTRYHVPPGRCEVWVTKNGYQPSERAMVSVGPGANSEVNVTLRKK